MFPFFICSGPFSGISPGVDFVLNLSRFATEEPIGSFLITVLMDMGLEPSKVKSSNAGLILKDSKTMVLSPREGTDLAQKFVNVGIEYTFDSNEVPAWRHPCIAAMECNVEYKSELGDKIWIIVGGVVGIIIVVFITVFCIGYCLKRFGSQANISPMHDVT